MRAAPVLLSLAVAFGVACGDHGPDTVAGTYTLRTMNGEGPPWFTGFIWQGTVDGRLVVVEETHELLGDSLWLNVGASYRKKATIQVTEVAKEQLTGDTVDSTVATHAVIETGTFTVAGNSIQFTPDPAGDTWTGTRTGDVLTVIVSGNEYVYRR